MKARLDSFTIMAFSEAEGELIEGDVRVPFTVTHNDNMLYIQIPADDGGVVADVTIDLWQGKLKVHVWDQVDRPVTCDPLSVTLLEDANDRS